MGYFIARGDSTGHGFLLFLLHLCVSILPLRICNARLYIKWNALKGEKLLDYDSHRFKSHISYLPSVRCCASY